MLIPARQTPHLPSQQGNAVWPGKIRSRAGPCAPPNLLSHQPPPLPRHFWLSTPQAIAFATSRASSSQEVVPCRVPTSSWVSSAACAASCTRRPPINFCTDDFGPLEVAYDYDAIAERSAATRSQPRPQNMWRYRELLPLDGEPTVGPQVGGTPLIRADRLADALGVEQLWIKNDAVNFPTLSFKDRVVSRGAVARRASSASRRSAAPAPATSPTASRPTPPRPGWRRYILVPADLERAKILGTSDLRREGRRRDRHLRPGEPPLHADRVQVRLGLRERQPAAVLRRGVEDDGLRDRRGPRLAVPAARRLPDGRRQPDRQDPQGVQRTEPRRPRRSSR